MPIPENREQLYAILLKMAQVISQKLANPIYIAILRIVFAESGRFPELSELFRKTIPRSTGILINLLRQLIRTGLVHLEEDDLDMSMTMFVGPFITHSVFFSLMSGDQSPEPMPQHALEQLCRLYLDAITERAS
ncbi:TetR/AcrR family transcriptional regulator C-terminal domain-containing protein [Paenibacillaceae bacterium WGS1546]|uniref:TetR/AcrR family transcriptional regulator C-terminal domain-containing protein n=1 Tax=Cohnella sp. WGS1546 TaxID=3366810 RepID=UPI00372D30D0